MNGLIILNKSTGITSAKALYRVRSITRQRKSGHAGTLDPAASGVLILCMGKATKLVEMIMDQPKVYRATARLDVTSESFDLDRPLIPVDVADPPTAEVVHDACREFEGEITQVPPKISAVKVGGVPAYKRTHRQQDFELKARPAMIYWLHIHSYAWPTIDFEMCCGRGTYVRSLIRDLGESLGTGGCLTSLVRRSVGPFTEEQAYSLDRLEAARSCAEYLIELDAARALLVPDKLIIPPRPD
ncbi:MAG: tRNA pseudouridine(55) synthase TruB [Phycisphaerales bacterium]|nr:MAG: tRNA pseudouridine(55) synthase TruB [Phycisphaerales bacterium]